MKKPLQFLVLCLCLLSVVGSWVTPASAVIVDANTGGGNTGNSTAATGGYSIPGVFADEPTTIFAMRFSVYNTKTGRSSTSIDVVNTLYPNWSNHINNTWVTPYAPSGGVNSSILWNHRQWADEPLHMHPAGKGNVRYSDTLGIALPTYTTGFETAVKANDELLNKVLNAIGYTGDEPLDSLTYYDKILCEPVYPITVKGTAYNMTVAEIAAYGYNQFGPDVTPASSATQGSWGFIADYTNRHFPNALYAGNGSDVFPSSSELTGIASFRTLLNYGYGTGIAIGF